jgi:molybdenum cofactor guanylyltransferase
MSIDSEIKKNITGIVLAGGQGRRMGGQDKGLIKIRDKYLINHVISALSPQVDTVFINANRNQSLYKELTGCLVFSDNFGHFEGPLAGIFSGLEIAQTDYVLFVPCDSPLLHSQLAQRLLTVLIEKNTHIAVAHDGMRVQPMFVLIRKQLMANLRAFLVTGQRKTSQWYAEQLCVEVDFSDISDIFLNINSPEQFKTLELKLR